VAIHRKILRWLENELFEGNIQLGQDLPSDSEIARAIGVSRSRTREALRTLEDMDLVQLYNGRGKEMLVHLSDEPAAAASAALRLHMSSSRYPTRDLVQTRILLESWAIARIDPKTASFAEMDEVLEQMEDFDLSIRDFLELLLTFHHQVMRCAGNELLVGLLASVRQPSFESMLSLVGRMPLWSSAVERLRAESRAIAEALKAGDAATARAMVIGQLRGMYSDAGIDLEQEATSANGLPGEPIASEFAPVDVDEFAADDFDDLMQDDASFADVGALPAAEAPVAASAEPTQVPAPVSAAASAQSADVEYEQSESEAAHVEIVYIEETASEIPSAPTDTSAETTTGADVSASDRVERSIPAVAQPASAAAPAQPAAHSVSPDVPLSFGTPRRSTPVAQTAPAASAAPVSGVQAPASQTLASQPLSSQTLSSQTPSGQLPSVPDAYAQEEAESPAKVLRASTAAPRRRSGQIISPVRATIIKPVDRSKVLTAPARTARPAAVVTAAAPAESESAEKVLRAPARQEAPAAEPAEPTRLEAAATIHDTYEKLPHDEPVQERGGIFSKMKRFFGVDVYEPEHDEAQESAEKKQVLKAETKPESQPEPQPVIDEEALARAEAERAERLKALHAAVEEEAAEESAIEEVSVEEPVEEPAEASDPAQESVEAASPAEESTPDAAVASSGSVLSHGGAKGSKKSKKKRR
jgi:transcriptional regulator, GntR family